MTKLGVLKVNGVEVLGLRVVNEVASGRRIVFFLDDRLIIVDHTVIVVVHTWFCAYSQLRSRSVAGQCVLWC